MCTWEWQGRAAPVGCSERVETGVPEMRGIAIRRWEAGRCQSSAWELECCLLMRLWVIWAQVSAFTWCFLETREPISKH